MNIKATLARLGNSMADSRAARDLLLLPGDTTEQLTESSTVNIVVGYSGSPNSQRALDLALLIAYQTRLATRKQVIVQTVYVLEGIYQTQKPVLATTVGNGAVYALQSSGGGTAVATASPRRSRHTINCVDARAAQIQCFEAADQVLWQARTFATEWKGSLNTHLRFGTPAVELSQVAQQEQANVMVVGCHSVEHPLIQQLKATCECPVIGIPEKLEHAPLLKQG